MKKFVFGLLFVAIFGLAGQILAAGEVVTPPAGQPGPINIQYTPPCLLPTQLGECPETVNSITDYLLRLYNFAVGIIGVLALGMIVAGAIMISVSGAVDKKKEGIDMIKSAIWGVVLLLGSYLILNTINPALTQLKEPYLEATSTPQFNYEIELLNILENPNFISCAAKQDKFNGCISSDHWLFAIVDKDNQSQVLTDYGTDNDGYECKYTGSAISRVGERGLYRPCQPSDVNQFNINRGLMCNFMAQGINSYKEKCATAKCENCELLRNDVSVKSNTGCQFDDRSQKLTNCVCTWSTGMDSRCSVNRRINEKLNDFKTAMTNAGINWQVTEAFPPTVDHLDSCHFNGKCIDVSLTNPACQNVERAIEIALGHGVAGTGFGTVINEYLIPDCPGVPTPYSTGNHLHLEL